MRSRQLLGAAIVAVLAGAIAAAIVKSGEERPLARPTRPAPAPTTLLATPTAAQTTPALATPTPAAIGTQPTPAATGPAVTPTGTLGAPTRGPELPRTGAGSFALPGLLLGLAGAAGWATHRAGRTSSTRREPRSGPGRC
jgi:hypothetical protein